MSRTVTEFYDAKVDGLIASVDASAPMTVGCAISIRGKTYLVQSVTFALDHADSVSEDRILRCNVDVRKVK